MDERRRSILKQKIRVPLQEVLLPDFADDETVTTTTTRSRRVSFGTNLIKEFIKDSAVSTQCISEYEQAFSSSDSSNANSSRSGHGSQILEHSTFSAQENEQIKLDCHGVNVVNEFYQKVESVSLVKSQRVSKNLMEEKSDKNCYDFDVEPQNNIFADRVSFSQKSHRSALSDMSTDINRSKHEDFDTSHQKSTKQPRISTVHFSADSPSTGMEFTEGCINLVKNIYEKKKREMTVLIQAKQPHSGRIDETVIYGTSDAEMSITKCVRPTLDDSEDCSMDYSNCGSDMDETDVEKPFVVTNADGQEELVDPFPIDNVGDSFMDSMEVTDCDIRRSADDSCNMSLEETHHGFLPISQADDSCNMSLEETHHSLFHVRQGRDSCNISLEEPDQNIFPERQEDMTMTMTGNFRNKTKRSSCISMEFTECVKMVPQLKIPALAESLSQSSPMNLTKNSSSLKVDSFATRPSCIFAPPPPSDISSCGSEDIIPGSLPETVVQESNPEVSSSTDNKNQSDEEKHAETDPHVAVNKSNHMEENMKNVTTENPDICNPMQETPVAEKAFSSATFNVTPSNNTFVIGNPQVTIDIDNSNKDAHFEEVEATDSFPSTETQSPGVMGLLSSPKVARNAIEESEELIAETEPPTEKRHSFSPVCTGTVRQSLERSPYCEEKNKLSELEDAAEKTFSCATFNVTPSNNTFVVGNPEVVLPVDENGQFEGEVEATEATETTDSCPSTEGQVSEVVGLPTSPKSTTITIEKNEEKIIETEPPTETGHCLSPVRTGIVRHSFDRSPYCEENKKKRLSEIEDTTEKAIPSATFNITPSNNTFVVGNPEFISSVIDNIENEIKDRYIEEEVKTTDSCKNPVSEVPECLPASPKPITNSIQERKETIVETETAPEPPTENINSTSPVRNEFVGQPSDRSPYCEENKKKRSSVGLEGASEKASLPVTSIGSPSKDISLVGNSQMSDDVQNEDNESDHIREEVEATETADSCQNSEVQLPEVAVLASSPKPTANGIEESKETIVETEPLTETRNSLSPVRNKIVRHSFERSPYCEQNKKKRLSTESEVIAEKVPPVTVNETAQTVLPVSDHDQLEDNKDGNSEEEKEATGSIQTTELQVPQVMSLTSSPKPTGIEKTEEMVAEPPTEKRNSFSPIRTGVVRHSFDRSPYCEQNKKKRLSLENEVIENPSNNASILTHSQLVPSVSNDIENESDKNDQFEDLEATETTDACQSTEGEAHKAACLSSPKPTENAIEESEEMVVETELPTEKRNPATPIRTGIVRHSFDRSPYCEQNKKKRLSPEFEHIGAHKPATGLSFQDMSPISNTNIADCSMPIEAEDKEEQYQENVNEKEEPVRVREPLTEKPLRLFLNRSNEESSLNMSAFEVTIDQSFEKDPWRPRVRVDKPEENSLEVETLSGSPTPDDSKMIETLLQQSKEPDCFWKIIGTNYFEGKAEGLWSFAITLQEVEIIMEFGLKTVRDGHSIVAPSQNFIRLVKNDSIENVKDRIIGEFAFEKMRQHFREEVRKINNVHYMPYFMDLVNFSVKKLLPQLSEISLILKKYPGSRLCGNILTFRLYSFPLSFSSNISIDLSQLPKMTKNSVKFELHFGKLNENRVVNILEDSLKCKDPLIQFIVSSTNYVIALEKEKSGWVTIRDHIRLLAN